MKKNSTELMAKIVKKGRILFKGTICQCIIKRKDIEPDYRLHGAVKIVTY
jgi:hypothetical protein